eukprot:6185410-Pleurochrysis_carterae.AAC.3
MRLNKQPPHGRNNEVRQALPLFYAGVDEAGWPVPCLRTFSSAHAPRCGASRYPPPDTTRQTQHRFAKSFSRCRRQHITATFARTGQLLYKW